MILIADSGSTKTAWWMGDAEARSFDDGCVVTTQGINPFQMTVDEMVEQIHKYKVQSTKYNEIATIHFYGAGCTKEKAPSVETALHRVFGDDADVFVGSDMLGAAHAVSGDSEGIVCILGTGSNSCLYDGREIKVNVSPLGYILGDEGSGAYIGKRLVSNCLKRQFCDALCEAFMEETGLTPADIVQRTYREPLPNRFLASLSPFCSRHRDQEEIRLFLIDCFSEFFQRNVALYHRKDLSVHFVGSIAWQYERELKAAASLWGFRVGNILKEPLSGMVNYVLCK